MPKKADFRALVLERLANQHLTTSPCRTPGELLAWLGAIQAQDYLGALWAIGARLPGFAEADVLRAIEQREIVRTWPMRGTLNFVPAADADWMLALMTPRILARAERRHGELELSPEIYARCRKLLGKALAGCQAMTREALQDLLGKAGIPAIGPRGYHIFWRLAQEGFLCFGPHAGKKATFVLLEEWVPKPRKLEREAALAEIARRFFTSRGPASVADFIWWTGLPAADARRAVALAAPHIAAEKYAGQSFYRATASAKLPAAPPALLLPPFDEYLLGYTDRAAVLDPQHAEKIIPGANGMFKPIIVLKGRVEGIWSRTVARKAVRLQLEPFAPLKPAALRACEQAAANYAKFLNRPLELAD